MEVVKEAWRSIISNKVRSALSMLGIIIGIAAVIAVVSITEGAKRNISENIQALGSNVILVLPGYIGGRGGVAQGVEEALKISDVEKIKNICPSVELAVGVVQRSLPVSQGSINTFATVYSSHPEIFKILNLKVSSGRILNYEDEKFVRNVAVVGQEIAYELFEEKSPVNERIFLVKKSGNQAFIIPFKIVGLLEQTGSKMTMNPDRSIIIPYSTGAYKLFNNQDILNFILISAKNREKAEMAVYEVDHLLYMKFKDENYYRIISQEQILNVFDQAMGVMNLVLVSIAGISLLVGGIGIMNIMLVSVAERTREIGVKMAIGATRKRIMLEFLIESSMITFIAGIMGIAAGIFLSKLIALIGKNWNLRAVTSFQAILIATVVSISVGLFFGMYPARKASKLSPVEALRYE